MGTTSFFGLIMSGLILNQDGWFELGSLSMVFRTTTQMRGSTLLRTHPFSMLHQQSARKAVHQSASTVTTMALIIQQKVKEPNTWIASSQLQSLKDLLDWVNMLKNSPGISRLSL